MLCKVLKQIATDAEPLAIGTIVDTTGWRNAARLIDQRRMRPILAEELETLTAPTERMESARRARR